jgi:hypothetical protein
MPLITYYKGVPIIIVMRPTGLIISLLALRRVRINDREIDRVC